MPIPSNGQNFVRPQSGGSGGWISKLFGGIGDVARAKDMAQIQFDLHQAKAGVDTEHQGTRIKQKVAAESAGKVYVGDANAKRAIKTFKKFTDPKEEYVDKAGRKRTRGGFGLQVESPLSNFDSNMLPAFQKTGLSGRKKTEGAAPVDSDAGDGGNPPNPPGGGGAGKTPRKPRAKKTSGAQPKGSTGSPDTPDASSGAPAVTAPKTRKPRAPKAGA
jgi:hypothetical protein